MREIWLMQPRFDRRTPSGAAGLASQPRFRAGYDFLRLRADTGEVPVELADWWEDFHLGSDEDREALLADVRATQQPKVRRVPGPKSARRPALLLRKPKQRQLRPTRAKRTTRLARPQRRRPASAGAAGAGLRARAAAVARATRQSALTTALTSRRRHASTDTPARRWTA